MKFLQLSILSTLILLSGCGGGGDSGNDRNFDTGSGFDQRVESITVALDGSGDVYVGGSFGQFNGSVANRLVRLNRNGSLDMTFDANTGLDGSVFDIEAIDDGTGDVYLGGTFTQFRGNTRNRIIRVKPDGTEASVNFNSGFDSSVFSLALNAGKGDLYAGGDFSAYGVKAVQDLARIDPNGTPDNVFSTGSGFGLAFGTAVASVAVSRDGVANLYAGGFFDSYQGNPRSSILRTLPSGAIDPGFNPGSGFTNGGNIGFVDEIAVAKDGANDLVYAGGNFDIYRLNPRNNIARINADGANDGSFVTGAGFNNEVNALALALDGSNDVYIGGHFTSYDGASAVRIARLNFDGSLDTGFVTGSGFDSNVRVITPASDGSGDIYVGGNFTTYNGTPVGRIVRLNADGSMD